MDRPGPERTSVRRELLVSTAILFTAGVLVAVSAVAVTLPLLDSPVRAAIFIGGIVVADLAIILHFLRSLLVRSVFRPLEHIGEHAERIAGGAYDPTIPPEPGEELDRLIRSLNTMAEKFISDQVKLSDNVRSLDRTNQELVATTEELVRAARLASVGTLASGVAHEVGNPLGALMGCLDVLKRRAETGGDMVGPIDSASEEARRIDRIVRSILDFARPSERGEAIDAISVPDVLDRSLSLLDGRGALKGVSVERIVQPGTHLVRARAQHVEQVLLNLLMNALWAMRNGHEPQLRVRIGAEPTLSRSVRARRADDPPGVNYTHRRRIPLLMGRGTAREAMEGPLGARDVVLRVEDNGPGIPPDLLPRVFDPFFTTKAPGEGTGLGLTITARIVQELGGTVDADNREQGGARFTVRLPEAGEGET
jgi:C4-dicarboxylate-specific signal transduction histidine kinase